MEDFATARSDGARAMIRESDSISSLQVLVDGFRRENAVFGRVPTENVRGRNRNSGSSNNLVDDRGMKCSIEKVNVPMMGVGVPKVFSMSRNGVDGNK